MFEYAHCNSLDGSYGSAEQQLNALTALNRGLWSDLFGPIPGWGASLADPEDENGWHFYVNGGCPKNKLCQFYQPVTEQIWVGFRNEFHPEFNISNLKWRLTGVGKEGYDSK